MLKKIAIVTIFMSLFSFSSYAKFYPEADAILEKENFWAQVSFKEEGSAAIVNFRVWFQAAPDKVFEVLTNTNALKNLENFNDSRALTKNIFEDLKVKNPANPNEVRKIIGANRIASQHNRQKGQNWTDYVFFEFNFPWPLQNRWVIQKVRLDETNASKGEYKYEYKMQLGNVKTLEGYWKLLPVEGKTGWTEFRGHYESDPGISVPRFVLKKGVKTGLKKDIQAYRQLLK